MTDKDKEKVSAILRKAVIDGKIIKPKICEGCGKRRKLKGHHDDYSQPLKVRWLCYNCHSNIVHQVSKGTQFKKNYTPWNKGKHPEYVQGKNNYFYGKHHTKKTKKKMKKYWENKRLNKQVAQP